MTNPMRQSRLGDEPTRVPDPSVSPGPPQGVPSRPPQGVRDRRDPSRRRAVLLAEDKPVNQLVARRLLELRGCRVDVAENGRVALDMYVRGGYELIFMDCQMPELDGYQVATEIRRQEGSERHTPIVAMTANTMIGDRDRCLRAGMDDYLAKPLQPGALDRILARTLWADDPLPDPDPDPDAASDDGDTSARQPVLDPSQMRDICDRDIALRRKLVAMFLDQARSDITTMAAAAAAGQGEAARASAHALAGSSAVIGAKRLSEVAGRICAAVATHPAAGALPHQAELELVYELTAAALSSPNDPIEVAS